MIIKSQRRRRLLANGAIAIAVATGTSVGVALAGGGGSTTPPPTTAKSAAETDSLAQFHAALQSLVTDGTITQTQADAIRRQIDTGALDPQALLSAGVVDAAQMQAVADRLADVKRGIASRLGGGGGTTAAAGKHC